MTGLTQIPSLGQIQQPVADDLAPVVAELRRIVFHDFPAIGEVNDHLLWARGKLFRPTLVLLSTRLGDRRYPHAIKLLHPVGHSYYAMLREKLNWNRE